MTGSSKLTKQDVVVFSAPHQAALREMLAISEQLPNKVSAFFIFNDINQFNNVSIDESSVGYASWVPRFSQSKEKHGIKRRLRGYAKSKLKYFLDDTWLGCQIQKKLLREKVSKKLLKTFERQYTFVDSALEKFEVKKVVISNDRSVSLEAILSKWASDNSIDVVIPPVAYTAYSESLAKLRLSRIYRNQHDGKIKASSVMKVGEDQVSFYRPSEQDALVAFGAYSRNPWALGAGLASKVLVESDRESKRLIKMGTPVEKIIVTGHMSHDAIWTKNEQRSDIRKNYIEKYLPNLNDRPLVLLALPQFWEHHLCDEERHFEIIELLCEECAKVGGVLISLHPKMDINNYRYLETKFDVKILEEPLRDVIVVADIFVANYSSTVGWALLCKIKTVIVDFIGLNYTDFYSEFHIPVVNSRIELRKELEGTLESDRESENTLISALSPFDGACSARILEHVGQ